MAAGRAGDRAGWPIVPQVRSYENENGADWKSAPFNHVTLSEGRAFLPV
jgi:hypothetical protein